MIIFRLVEYIWPGGEVANAAVCKTAIHGCKSHLGLKFAMRLIQPINRASAGIGRQPGLKIQ
jgi:hypothetical protein